MIAWLAACSGPDDRDHGKPPDPTGSAPTASTGGPTGDTGDPTDPLPGWVAAPTWVRNPDGARLVGTVEAELSVPLALHVVVDDGVAERTFESADATVHQLLVLGLRPDTTHVVTVTAGELDPVVLTVVTEPLPPELPPVAVTIADRARMEPGVTFLVMADWMVMYDADGVPAWLRQAPSGDVHEVAYTSRGTLLFQADRSWIGEMSLTGKILRSWRAARSATEPADAVPVDVTALHHDVVELPDGNLLGLSVERRSLPAYPTSERDPAAPPAPADVAGDVIVEFRPDGTLVHEWPLLDRLDPERIAYDSVHGDFWYGFFGGDEVHDWSHANALGYDPVRDEVVVSLRHQDAVVGLAHATGEVAWIVAPDANWREPLRSLLFHPAEPGPQPYHQHAARIAPDGHLTMFDNGNRRASAFERIRPDDRNASRGLELVLDHAARTWTIAWEWGQYEPPRFSGSLGDTDELPLTGNRLVTFGNVKDPAQPGVVVDETTGGDAPELVWSLAFPQGDALGTFRAARLTDVIPQR